MPQQQRHPLLRHVQPGRAPGVLRRALHPRGPVAVPALPSGPRPASGLRALPEQRRGPQEDGRRPLGPRGLRPVGARGGLLQHRFHRAHRRRTEHSAGALEANVLPLQGEECGGLHPVPPRQLLHRLSRQLRPEGRPLHEDGARQGDDGRRRPDLLGEEDRLLRRAHPRRMCPEAPHHLRRGQSQQPILSERRQEQRKEPVKRPAEEKEEKEEE